MKVGIVFHDNDFCNPIRMFIQLFVLPTFIDRGEGHMVTHLTSSMIVEMFNTYCVHCYKWLKENDERYKKEPFDIKWYQQHLKITETNVVWDGALEEAITMWHSEGVYWTDGKHV